MLEQTIRLHTCKTIYLICHFLHAYFTFYSLIKHILSCQILFFFHLKMMTWSHRLFLPIDVSLNPFLIQYLDKEFEGNFILQL